MTMGMKLGLNVGRYFLARASARSLCTSALPPKQTPRLTPNGILGRLVCSTVFVSFFLYWVDYGDFRTEAEDRKANYQRVRQEVEELEVLLESKRQEAEKLEALFQSKSVGRALVG